MYKLMILTALLLSTASVNASAQTFTSKGIISTNNGDIVLTERMEFSDEIHRRFLKEDKVLYESRARLLPDGLEVDIQQGHPSQLGKFFLKNNILEANDVDGKMLWREELNAPVCPPEFGVEFIRANWDKLQLDSEPLQCVIPIIKAKKVAPVKWVRQPDNENNERVVELKPGSFGMRFFLETTRFTFSADGETWLSQDGQFESTRDPETRPRYLKGAVTLQLPRPIPLVARNHFGGKE